MRIAYLDCFAGISGDMFLGALLDAGVPFSVLTEATAAMNLGATLNRETVDRSGISATKVHVLEGDHLAEHGARGTSHILHQQTAAPHQHQPKTQHQHKTGTPHTHEHTHENTHDEPHAHTHTHGRSLTVIRELIQASPLAPAVRTLAIRTFELLGHSEAKIHNVPVDEIHFHEVGAVDAIVDIVAASAGIVHLQIGAWHSSPVNVGGGMVVCAHGTFPVPAPATADLLRGMPTYSAHIQKELVTPTGAALLKALAPTFGPQPAMAIEHIGYGAGTRNPDSFPNVLRLCLGETTEPTRAPFIESHPISGSLTQTTSNTDTVTVLETALDDTTPQLLAYVAEQALALGALDIMLTPVLMKKGRPGTLLTLLCTPETQSTFEHLLLTETTTLGLRIRQDQRTTLTRTHHPVQTPFGEIRVKVGTLNGTELNATPEYEDCRQAAQTHKVPLKTVQQSAIKARTQN